MNLWQSIKARFSKRSNPYNGTEPPRTGDSYLPSDPRLAALLLSSAKSRAGVVVNEYSALSYGAVYLAVRVIAEAVASLPIHIYEKQGDGNRKQIDEHWAGWLLRENPNDDMTPFTFRETIQGHICTWGNGYAEIVRNNNAQPVELIPLRPDRMKVMRINTGLTYIYTNPNGKPTHLDPADVLHIPGLSFDGLVGYSPIQLAMDSIGLGLAAERFGASFFGNGAMPGGALKTPQKLSDQAYTRLIETWEKEHMGPDNAGKYALLEEGLDWVTIGIPPEQAQFIETRSANIDDIARWFKLPPHKLGSLSRATWANIEQQEIDFVTHSILPWLKRWEQEINRKLFSRMARGRQYAEFSVEGLLRGDSTARAAFYTSMFSLGVYSPNEIRAKENEDGFGPDGDQRLVPLNMRPLEEPPQSEEPQQAPETPADAAPAKPEQRSLAAQETIVAAHQELLADVLGRMVTRETESVRRAAKQPKQFIEKLDKFYAEHRSTLATAIRPSLRAHYLVLGWQDRSEMVAGYVAEQLCLESRSAWIDLSGTATAANLEAAVNGLAVEWEQGRASELARRALEEWSDGRAA